RLAGGPRPAPVLALIDPVYRTYPGQLRGQSVLPRPSALARQLFLQHRNSAHLASKSPADAKPQTRPQTGWQTDMRQSQLQPAATADSGAKENWKVGFARLTRRASVDLLKGLV